MATYTAIAAGDVNTAANWSGGVDFAAGDLATLEVM